MRGGNAATSIDFPEMSFPRKFHVLEVERGIYRYVEELPGRVMAYTTLPAIASAILSFVTDALPEQFAFYKFTASKARECAEFWSMREVMRFAQRIYPVLELSQAGFCYRRFDFDATEGPCPLFDDLLKHVKTNREALLAFIGGLQDPDFRRQFYLWLWGVGGDGKGTLMRLLFRLYGNAYAALSSSPKAQESQFFTSALPGKRIAAFQDCHNPKLVQSEIFMQLSGGDPLRIEPKGKDAYTTEVDAIPIVSANSEPVLTGSHAHIRRAVIVEFSPRERYADPQTFEERLWEERAAILWKCKEAWRRMKEEHGGLVIDQDPAHGAADESEEMNQRLMRKYLVTGENLTVKQHDLYDILVEQAKLNDIQVGAFKKYLKRVPGVAYKQQASDGKRVWRGVGLVTTRYAATEVNGETRF